MMQVLGYLLLMVHFLLLFWSVGGYLEMVLPRVFWKPFTNSEFPNWLLVVHWGSVLLASAGFVYGYLTHWSRTPQVMAFAYGLMALVCVVETFGYMTSSTKYVTMGAEFLAYTVILLLLFRSGYFIAYFNH